MHWTEKSNPFQYRRGSSGPNAIMGYLKEAQRNIFVQDWRSRGRRNQFKTSKPFCARQWTVNWQKCNFRQLTHILQNSMKQSNSVAAKGSREDKKQLKQVWTKGEGRDHLGGQEIQKGKKVIKLQTTHVHCELKLERRNFLLTSTSCHSTSEMQKGV